MIDYYKDSEYILKFLNYMSTVRGKSKRTVREYYLDLRIFFRFIKLHKKLVPDEIEFENIDLYLELETLKDITLSDLYEYMNFLNNVRNNSSRSRSRKVASLRSFFKFVHKKLKIIDQNPAEDLESPKNKHEIPRYLNLEESLNLLHSIQGPNDKRDYCMLTIFLNCGLRLSELVSIDLDDVRGETLTVEGKGNKERTVYLNQSCEQAIKNYLSIRSQTKTCDKSNALFLSNRKRRISIRTVQWTVEKYISKIGLSVRKYTTHKLRHTAATLMYQNGVDLRVIQEILGHAHLSTTEIYTHTSSAKLKEGSEKNPLSTAHNL